MSNPIKLLTPISVVKMFVTLEVASLNRVDTSSWNPCLWTTRIHLSYINGLMQEKRNSSALAMELHFSCTNPLIWFRALGGMGVRDLGPWKSNGALVKFCLRAQWTLQNWRIGNVFQLRDPSNFAWALRNSNGGNPRALNKKCLPRALMVNAMAAVDLAMQGAGASAAIVLTQVFRLAAATQLSNKITFCNGCLFSHLWENDFYSSD